MAIIPVQVRHSGQKYEVQLDTDEPGAIFKMQLYSLTGVPPDRQKILAKGGQLKDDSDMSSFRENHSFMMLGSAEDLPKSPVVKHQFVEDMSDSQIATKQKFPNGLTNVGNTCYLNSALQAMKTVPELQLELEKYTSRTGISGSFGFATPDLTAALRDVYRGMGSTTIAYTPMGFVNALRQLFVQFDERGGDGLHKQQDAEEAWSQIFSVLRSSLNDPTFVDKYFGGRFETTLKCDEAENEPPKVETVDFLKLECHISISTNFLRDGLLDGLKEKIEKHSETLNRDAQYTLSKKITRLPKYLTVHYVRFFWRRDTNKKSKILRKVSFPFNFDATELCSDELQKKIIPAREKHREVEKEKQEMESTLKKQKNNNGTSSIPSSKQAEFESQIAQAVDEDLKNDVGCNPTGLYQLSAVITHQGPNADGGHYQCFSRNDQEEGKWFRFNDDTVTIVDQTKIEQLAGGGEFDSALILLYKAASI